MTRRLCRGCGERPAKSGGQLCKVCYCAGVKVERSTRRNVLDNDYLIVGPNWGPSTRLASSDVRLMLNYGFEAEDRLRQVSDYIWYRAEKGKLVAA